MKEFNKNGVFCLTAKVPEGKVKVMRVGDVDYIWTEGRLEDYLVFASAWSPFVYYYTLEGVLTLSIDPRTEGNQEVWYQSAYDAYGGGFNLTQLYAGDQEGFDLQYSSSLQWGYVVLLYRFSHGGALANSLTFAYTETPDVDRYNCEFAMTRYSCSVQRLLVEMTTWLHRETSYEWFHKQCDLYIFSDIDGSSIVASLVNSGVAGDWFNMWGARWMEDNFFYVDIYTNKEEYLLYARWSTLYKIDYNGNVLATAAQFQFPNNTDHLYKFDTGTGLIRTNKDYVVHFSTYGQYIRVWDKDLNFIKNVAVDPNIGNYGRIAGAPEAYTWCQMLGFIKNEVYIMTGGYDFDYSGGGSGGYHKIYVYDISKDAGDEYVRTFKIYPPDVKVFGTTKAEVFEEGITLEGYHG